MEVGDLGMQESEDEVGEFVMKKSEDELKLTDCVCRNLRMTTRVITQYYDKALIGTGLKAAQFSLLNSILSKKEGISVNDLAEISLMDQTTATRNIKILHKTGFVDVEIEDTDSRRKRITVSNLGKRKLAEAMPYWQKAQLNVQKSVGIERYRSFMEVLQSLRNIE